MEENLKITLIETENEEVMEQMSKRKKDIDKEFDNGTPEIILEEDVNPEFDNETSEVVLEEDANKECFEPYLICITTSALNIRSGPGMDTSIIRTLINDKSIYTIIEETIDQDGKKWGKLKSDMCWIALDYTEKV